MSAPHLTTELGSPCPPAVSTHAPAELPWWVGSTRAEGHICAPCLRGWGLTQARVLQVLQGCEDSELQQLHLQRNPALYNFTRQGAGLSVSRGSPAGPRAPGLAALGRP